MKNLNPTAKTIILLFIIFCDPPSFSETATLYDNMRVAGWVENVSLFPGNLKIKAKLDTGARHSSLNANHIEEFERDGEKWVRFKLINWKGRTAIFEAKVIRTAKIKQHGTGTPSAPRPVIRLGICLGNAYKEVEVNLQDRGKFNYQMLIGRSYLKKSFLVDASRTFTIQPLCQEFIDQ